MMMNKLNTVAGFGILLITLLLAAGCSKDKYASKPSLKFKSASSYDVPNGGLLTMRLEYTDAEGDLSTADSAITFIRTVARCNAPALTYRYALPTVPATKNASGEIVIRFENSTQNFIDQGFATYSPSTCINSNRPDTTTFRFFIRDKAGNVSDTVFTDRPIIIRP